MRIVARYRNPSQPGTGLREFLYPQARSEEQVREHAQVTPPEAGWELVDVRPADDTEYREVSNG